MGPHSQRPKRAPRLLKQLLITYYGSHVLVSFKIFTCISAPLTRGCWFNSFTEPSTTVSTTTAVTSVTESTAAANKAKKMVSYRIEVIVKVTDLTLFLLQ